MKNNLPTKSHLVIVDQIIVSGGNFVVTFALARYLSKPEFGAFVIAQSILFLSMQVHSALIVSPIGVLASPLKENDAKIFFRALNSGQIVVSLSLVGVALFVSGLLFIWPKTAEYFPIFCAMATVIFFNLSQSYIRHILFSRVRIVDALKNDLICYGLQLIVTILLLWCNSLNALTAIFAIGITSFLACLYGLYQCKDYFGATKISMWEGLRPCIEYGKWLLGSGVMAWLRTNLNLYVAMYFLGITAPAILKAVQTIFGPTHILLNGLESIIPQFATRIYKSGGLAPLNSFLSKIVIILGSGMFLYSGIITCFSEKVLKFLYNEQYSGYGSIVVIVAIQYFFITITTGPNIALRVAKLPRLIFKANVMEFAVSALASIIFVVGLGINGAALSKVFSALLLLILLIFFYRKSEF